MENKNLNDIIIEDAETSKGNQLKNILTLLALLFIILVISIVITKLILGGDDETDNSYRTDGTVQELNENNLTTTASNGLNSASNSMGDAISTTGATLAGAAAVTAATVALTSKNRDTDNATQNNLSASTNKAPLLAERNTTSRTKEPLRTEESTKKNVHTASTQTVDPKKNTHHLASTYTRPKYIKKNDTATKHTTSHHSTPKKTTTHQTSSKKVTRGYYIKAGAYTNPSTAIRNIKAIKLNYKTTKTTNGLTRVLIGPFYSQRDAQNHLAKAKANVASDAYIAKIK